MFKKLKIWWWRNRHFWWLRQAIRHQRNVDAMNGESSYEDVNWAIKKSNEYIRKVDREL